MRYKFRGKRLDNGKWIEGCFAEFVHPIDGDTKPGIQVTRCVPSSIDRFMPVYETELVEVLPESVGQWTGLVDRHGKEIFEGDVIKKGLYNPDTLKVEFLNGWFGVFNEGGTRLLQFTEECVEVIGNVHDNPELMKTLLKHTQLEKEVNNESY